MVLELFSELRRHSPLLRALTERQLALRYRGSALGFLWSLLNPLCLMLVYVLVFKYYIRYQQVEHYHIFLFCGLLPWIWFSSGLSEGTQSVVASGHLITKAMFPAHILPAVSIVSSGINFILTLPLLVIFMVFAQVALTWTWLLVVPLILIQALFMFGLALGLASLNVRYRDVQHILANALSLLFFLCPIVYPASAIPERFQSFINANPCALFSLSYHQILFEGACPTALQWLTLAAWAVLALYWGTACYTRNRERFAELL